MRNIYKILQELRDEIEAETTIPLEAVSSMIDKIDSVETICETLIDID